MRRKGKGPAQTLDLFLSIAEQLGITGDRDIANLVGVSVETVANWRSGTVQEVKPQKLAAMKAGLAARIGALTGAGLSAEEDPQHDLVGVEVEAGSGPSDIQRQFRERILYDYLGHRFLYYDPQGALAWEQLIGTGYEQERWLAGVQHAAESWLRSEEEPGILAERLGLTRGARARGLDLISLGPGEGGKELRVLAALRSAEGDVGVHLPWITMALVDVSIPLLLRATRASRRLLGEWTDADHVSVLPLCADFEDGPLRFRARLPTERHRESDGVRLVLVLGNNFGNLRNEEAFVRQKLWQLMRPGDLVWLEVGIRPERVEDDPLYRLTQAGREETAADTSRKLLLQGPYRRWEAALGRPPSTLDMRVWLREDESARVPGSINFCHDLVIKEEGRSCTMFYSRRYDVGGLTRWLEEHGLRVEAVEQVLDGSKQPRVAHILASRW